MRSDHRAGFALPAVLAVTGVVTLIFLVAITALASLNGEARSARERVRFLESALSAEALVQYLAATEPLTGQALSPGAPRMLSFDDDTSSSVAPSAGQVTPVYLDGRPYQMNTEGSTPHSVVASLRDQAGMINLARLDDDQFGRLGNVAGMSPQLSRNLRALFADYTDEDDLETLGGAERSQYRGKGPADRFLIRPSEFLSILGVRQSADPRRWRGLRDDLAVDGRYAAINVNTASARTLQVLFGVTDQQAQAALRARDRAPFLSMDDFIAASGVNVPNDGESIFTFPAGRIVYTLTDTRSAWRYRARLILTPTASEQPFWVDQTEMTEGSRSAMAGVDAIRFPYTPR